MRTKYLLTLLVVLLSLLLSASPAQAGGVVTVCDETHLLAALDGGGTVTFACSGTITLTDQIVIYADTTIDGTGYAVSLRGRYPARVLKIMPGAALVLIKLTLTGGDAVTDSGRGGAIYNDGGALTAVDCAFTDSGAYSDGGGIYNSGGGSVNVANSTFSHNGAHYAGGAIYNHDGMIVVRTSTLENNGAGYAGGAIYNYYGVVDVRSSTFFENRSDDGGAISSGGVLTVTNCTFVGNDASGLFSGGGIYTYGPTTVVNSTFSGNNAYFGAGIDVSETTSATVTVANTIIANSVSGSNCRGPIIDGGGNLSFPDATCPGVNSDPVLGPLQHNGGRTETMALGPGSAAIDAGDNVICAAPPVNNLDQRGVIRPLGSHCDIGAVEQEPYKKTWLPLVRSE